MWQTIRLFLSRCASSKYRLKPTAVPLGARSGSISSRQAPYKHLRKLCNSVLVNIVLVLPYLLHLSFCRILGDVSVITGVYQRSLLVQSAWATICHFHYLSSQADAQPLFSTGILVEGGRYPFYLRYQGSQKLMMKKSVNWCEAPQ